MGINSESRESERHGADREIARGLVFVSGRNCASYLKACIGSLARQTYRHFDVLLVNDASTDGTADVAAQMLAEQFAGRHEIVRNDTQWGKARNAYELLTTRREADFVAILDGDDQLVDENVLEDMANAYAAGHDVVWTNYCTDRGRLGSNGALDPFQSPRGQGWRTSHFFSFRRCLIDSVPIAYFQDDEGQWLMAACDFAIAYPVLDQTRRYLFIRRAAYQYTETNENSHHNLDPRSQGLNSQSQLRNAAIVLQKKALPCTRLPGEVPAALHAALSFKFAQLNEKLDRALQDIGGVVRTVTQIPFVDHAVSELASKDKIPLSWLGDTGGWALDAGFLYHVSQTMDHYQNPRVLEFGSGRGSKSLARLCASRGGTLTSVEHNPQWFEHTRAELQSASLAGCARVLLCPLLSVEFYGTKGKFYDMKWLSESDIFDIVIIDGPPTLTCSLARLPALPAIAQHLSTDGFHVYLDDFEREEEQRIVQIWRTVAPDFKYQTLRFAKAACEITL